MHVYNYQEHLVQESSCIANVYSLPGPAISMDGVVPLEGLTFVPGIASMTLPDSQYLYRVHSTRNKFLQQLSSGLYRSGETQEAFVTDVVV